MLVLFTSRAQAQADTKVPDSINGQIEQSPDSQFCQDQNLPPEDGTQIQGGSCSSTPQGAIPSTSRMVSSLIFEPQSGSTVDSSKDLTVKVDLRNLRTGFFSNAQEQYYLVPQTLDGSGTIEGHCHITIQRLTSSQAAPDARNFDFFKGLNDEAPDGRTLSVTVPAGTLTQDGEYRICSLSGAFTHQPVIMPVAQRGAQDDCIRVTVADGGGGNNNSNDGGNNGGNGNGANNNNNNNNNGNGGNNNNGNGGAGRNPFGRNPFGRNPFGGKGRRNSGRSARRRATLA
ncbi:hypothetical protein HK097_002941 [Rhizophlyctis rosea]|uniref:Uncharacterized protein n=1 Tax=Rhizophlyctis rosea TaxID=64517 RepID=A0AAD5X342_9FUNG|nr:hypothetical protein HK097_002941 [Rhizophlyctis rosea]